MPPFAVKTEKDPAAGWEFAASLAKVKLPAPSFPASMFTTIVPFELPKQVTSVEDTEAILSSVASSATKGSGRTSTSHSLASFTETYQVPLDIPERDLVVELEKGALRV